MVQRQHVHGTYDLSINNKNTVATKEILFQISSGYIFNYFNYLKKLRDC